MRVLAVWSVKGGVGKTTTAVNLAYLSAGEGLRTLVWDLDPQGAASHLLRVRPIEGGARAIARRGVSLEEFLRASDFANLEVLPADLAYRHLDLQLGARRRPRRRLADKVAALAERYDLAVLDCPPSVSLLSEAVLRAADVLLIPVAATSLALRTVELARTLVAQRRHRPAVRAFLAMVDRRLRTQRELAAKPAEGGFLDTVVPLASVVERMGGERAPLAAFAPASEAAAAYTRLWAELRPELFPEPAPSLH
jgi:chromosome partitioning protein